MPLDPPDDGPVVPDFSATPLPSLISLDGRVAVVTGGARGIGLAVSQRLAEAGAEVVVADLAADGATSAAAGIPKGRAEGVSLDVTDRAAVDALVADVVARHGRLDILVNNAGIYPPTGDVLEFRNEQLDQVLNVNVSGALNATRAAANAMTGGGAIVNVISTSGFRASLGTSAYVISKHALVGLTRSMAIELGPRGIRVAGVAPENVDTPGAREVADRLKATGYGAVPRRDMFGRTAVADDIARVVLFLASDLAAWVSGSVIPVDAARLVRLG
jgi:NAD(P)-dependent dehydrogenase (short-subunit alcohol dehydrogenase family)